MFRIWAKIFKDNHMIKDMVVCDDSNLNRTKKIFNSLDNICKEFDLCSPIWLDKNIRDFKCNSKTRFTKDNFMEDIEFDFLEIHVIEN